MNDNTRHPAFQPAPLDQNTVLSLVSPWEAARIIEREASWLLEQCFPGWVQEADPEARNFWTGMCRKLLLDTGERLYELWATVKPTGDNYLMSRNSRIGSRLIVGLLDGEQNVQVHLGDLVLAELRRERVMDKGIEPRTFTFLNEMREEYQQHIRPPVNVTPEQGVMDAAATMTAAWSRNLRAALLDPETWRLPEGTPPTTHPSAEPS